jgi:hypothetical protein
MNSRALILGFLVSLSATGCGHAGHAPESAASLKNSGEAPSVASSRGSAEGYGAAASPAPAAGMADEVAKSESERPGLGTSWGEEVSSHVSSTSFYRQSDGSPDGLASLFYNDEAGVNAMSRGSFLDYGDSVVPLAGGRITVSIVDANGSPLRAAHLDGRLVTVGSDGDRYMLRIDNHSPVRVEAVATVDGLDVIDGQDGSMQKRGYVIAPYDTLDIEGFARAPARCAHSGSARSATPTRRDGARIATSGSSASPSSASAARTSGGAPKSSTAAKRPTRSRLTSRRLRPRTIADIAERRQHRMCSAGRFLDSRGPRGSLRIYDSPYYRLPTLRSSSFQLVTATTGRP